MSEADFHDRALQEGHYQSLWERLAGAAPLAEERDRWKAIEQLLTSALRRMDTADLSVEKLQVLDLGCGRGWITQLLTDRLPSANVLGVDPLAASVAAARKDYPFLSFQQATATELLEAGKSSTFHLVVASEVIEHVRHPRQHAFVEDVSLLLRPKGFLIFTTPRGELWKSWIARGGRPQPIDDWLTEAALDSICRRKGLAIVERTRAHVPKRPLNWPGLVERRLLDRRFLRDLPTEKLRRRLRHAASLYQAILLQRGV